ncbi:MULTISPECIES: hypothetical protein [unclassified Sphingomonas]|uniref:hypothetical protein n=1 Tax=unclassified Sphingomonas TaxID=196159 RepID=UPI0022B5CBE4|nr:hypothetical protein [Sphingomonas sp. NIBR02145]WHU01930.1 hypothetical protein O3305_17295 [Sphingomonas sp. NIBR02145]
MLLLVALTLSGATPAIDPQRRRAKARVTRVTRIPASARPVAAIPIVKVDPNQRYRLPLPSTEIADAKGDAVRNTGMACGTTGAPVCPSKGKALVKTSLSD